MVRMVTLYCPGAKHPVIHAPEEQVAELEQHGYTRTAPEDAAPPAPPPDVEPRKPRGTEDGTAPAAPKIADDDDDEPAPPPKPTRRKRKA